MFIWPIGALFTIGLLLDKDAKVSIGKCFIIVFTWPILLGMLVSGIVFKKEAV